MFLSLLNCECPVMIVKLEGCGEDHETLTEACGDSYQTFHRPEDVRIGLERSLQRMGLEYGELFIVVSVLSFKHDCGPMN